MLCEWNIINIAHVYTSSAHVISANQKRNNFPVVVEIYSFVGSTPIYYVSSLARHVTEICNTQSDKALFKGGPRRLYGNYGVLCQNEWWVITRVPDIGRMRTRDPVFWGSLDHSNTSSTSTACDNFMECLLSPYCTYPDLNSISTPRYQDMYYRCSVECHYLWKI